MRVLDGDDGVEDIAVVVAYGDDVVGVVRDGGGDGGVLDGKALDDAYAAFALAAVALHDNDLVVFLRWGKDAVDMGDRLIKQLVGDKAGDRVDDRRRFLDAQADAFGRDGAEVDRILEHRIAGDGRRACPLDLFAGVKDIDHPEAFKVAYNDQIGVKAGGNGALGFKMIVAGGVERGHADGLDGRQAEGNRFSKTGVDVPLPHDIVDMLVVGAEGICVGLIAVLDHALDDGLQIVGDAALADVYVHTAAALQTGVFVGIALMIA